MPLMDVISVVFPVFCTIAIGFLFASYKKLDLTPILDFLLYITIPALIISSLSTRDIEVSELFITFVSVGAVIAATGLLAFGYLSFTGRRELRGFYLPTIFMNSGNMAFPLSFLAFGKEGLSVAVLYYVAVSIMVYTVGVYIAKGSGGGLKEVFRLPLIYAAAIALGLNLANIDLPGPIFMTAEMLGAATIPLMQLSLGYRLYSARLVYIGPSVASSVIRIGGGVLAAYIIVTLLGIEGINKKVIILSSAMPAAVINFVMSSKYKINSDLVASAIAMSTIISVITTPIILYWLMH